MIYSPIGWFLHTLRRQEGNITPKEMAARLNISHNTLYSMERGSRLPPQNFGRTVCEAFGVNLADYNKWMLDYMKCSKNGDLTPDLPIPMASHNKGKTVAHNFIKTMCKRKGIPMGELSDTLSVNPSYFRYYLAGNVTDETTDRWIGAIASALDMTTDEENEFRTALHNSAASRKIDLSGLFAEDRANANRVIDALPALSSDTLQKIVALIEKQKE